MNEQVIRQFLLSILEELIDERITKEQAVCKLSSNQELTTQVVEKDVGLSISDCYWMIAHLTEESITDVEIQYFIDCYEGKREYNLQEKMLLLEGKNNNYQPCPNKRKNAGRAANE